MTKEYYRLADKRIDEICDHLINEWENEKTCNIVGDSEYNVGGSSPIKESYNYTNNRNIDSCDYKILFYTLCVFFIENCHIYEIEGEGDSGDKNNNSHINHLQIVKHGHDPLYLDYFFNEDPNKKYQYIYIALAKHYLTKVPDQMTGTELRLRLIIDIDYEKPLNVIIRIGKDYRASIILELDNNLHFTMFADRKKPNGNCSPFHFTMKKIANTPTQRNYFDLKSTINIQNIAVVIKKWGDFLSSDNNDNINNPWSIKHYNNKISQRSSINELPLKKEDIANFCDKINNFITSKFKPYFLDIISDIIDTKRCKADSAKDHTGRKTRDTDRQTGKRSTGSHTIDTYRQIDNRSIDRYRRIQRHGKRGGKISKINLKTSKYSDIIKEYLDKIKKIKLEIKVLKKDKNIKKINIKRNVIKKIFIKTKVKKEKLQKIKEKEKLQKIKQKEKLQKIKQKEKDNLIKNKTKKLKK